VTRYVPPQAGLSAFTCPRCGVLAGQEWQHYTNEFSHHPYETFSVARCTACNRPNVWFGERMVDPENPLGPPAHEDMPSSVLELYTEAREVAGRSPRSAAGLLRLALQMLLVDLEPDARDLNDAIGRLVQRGLEPGAQQPMDVLRVVGNNAVHPGEIVLDEDPRLIPALFDLANLVIEQMIARPARVQQLFAEWPESAREQIERRDESKEAASDDS
jgi:hypothetical protein